MIANEPFKKIVTLLSSASVTLAGTAAGVVGALFAAGVGVAMSWEIPLLVVVSAGIVGSRGFTARRLRAGTPVVRHLVG